MDYLRVPSKRLYSVMEKLGTDAKLMERYGAPMEAYLEDGITELVQHEEHYAVCIKQYAHFDVETKCISVKNKKTKKLSPRPTKLRLFVDSDDLLRVRGRAFSNDTYGAQFPPLLPKYTRFA